MQRKIVLDEIESLLVLHYPGRTANEKRTKAKLIRDHFEKASWTEIEKLMSLERLREGYDSLHMDLEKSPSNYHLPSPEPLDDEIPADVLGQVNEQVA